MPDRTTLHPQQIAQALNLNAEEFTYVMRFRVTSFDEFHARLLASPSLERTNPAIRRAHLLAELAPLLSPPYRAALGAPLPDIAWGVPLREGWSDNSLAGWPGADMPADLGGEASGTDLLGPRRGEWPLRDQGFAEPTCVPFAVNACLEWAAFKPGWGTEQLGSVFLYQHIRSRFGPLPGQGGAWLWEAAATLADDGVCRAVTWPDTNGIADVPSDAAIAEAATRRRHAECTNRGFNAQGHAPGAARVVLELLRRGVPVAITIPTFADPAAKRSNWSDAHAMTSGLIVPKDDAWVRVGGHAVCILGFQPALKDELGGFFTFRNSWGNRFATHPLTSTDPPGPDKPLDPTVPGTGYGVIGASQLDAHVTEIMVFP